MEVILQQDYPSLGYVGDRVKVKPGFARNFLIPRGVALEASSRNAHELNHKLAAVNAKKIKLREHAQKIAERLQGVKLDFMLRIGAGGRSFGSISVKEIEAALKKEGFELDKRQIRLLEPIRKSGEFKVQVKLHSEVVANVPVIVTAEAPAKAAAPAEGAEGEGAPQEKKRRSRKKAAAEEAPSEGTEEASAQSE